MAETKKPAVKKAPAKASKAAELSLNEQLVVKKADLLELKKSLAAGELVNPRAIGATRKEIARLKTTINLEKKGK